MKVLVTGATGFIGGYVIPELLARNISVVATSTSIKKAEEQLWFKKVTFVEHNIHQPGAGNLFEKFHRPDALIHLAWGGLPDFKNPVHVDEILPAHKAFLTNLIKSGLKDVTCTGTCLEYGLQEGRLSEDMESKPFISYPIAKYKLYEELNELRSSFSFSFKWVRLFYMHGKGQTPKSILPLLEKALENNDPVFNMSKGEQVRDYLPVNEVAENIVKVALQKEMTGIINCSSNQPITIKQLVLDFLKSRNKTIAINYGYYPYPDYEPFKFWGDNTKLLKVK